MTHTHTHTFSHLLFHLTLIYSHPIPFLLRLLLPRLIHAHFGFPQPPSSPHNLYSIHVCQSHSHLPLSSPTFDPPIHLVILASSFFQTVAFIILRKCILFRINSPRFHCGVPLYIQCLFPTSNISFYLSFVQCDHIHTIHYTREKVTSFILRGCGRFSSDSVQYKPFYY